MSLSYAIGSRTHAQPKRKGKTPASKTNESTTTSGTKTKSTTTTTKVNTPPKPRVVTLATLKQTSADRGKKTTKIHSRTPKKTAAQPAVRTHKMWDERESQSLSATGRNPMSVRGDRNAIASGYANRASSSTNGPAARGRLPGGDESLSHGQPTPDEERRDTYQSCVFNLCLFILNIV